jgi:hypothetical protein
MGFSSLYLRNRIVQKLRFPNNKRLHIFIAGMAGGFAASKKAAPKYHILKPD